MRLPFCALFLLMASRLFANSMASASVYCFASFSSMASAGDVSANASCPTASASSSLLPASVSVSEMRGLAYADLEADYTLLFTGGTGVGSSFMMGGGGTLMLGEIQTFARYDVKLQTPCGTEDFWDDDLGVGGGSITGQFTYGVPQNSPLDAFCKG